MTMKLGYLSIAALILYFICVLAVRPNKEDYIYNIIGVDENFVITSFEAKGEGLMGDLNRSWIIKFDKHIKLENFPMASWKKARPEYDILEMEKEVKAICSSYKSTCNFEPVYCQVIVPDKVLDIKGLVIVRVMKLEANQFFIKLESS